MQLSKSLSGFCQFAICLLLTACNSGMVPVASTSQTLLSISSLSAIPTKFDEPTEVALSVSNISSTTVSPSFSVTMDDSSGVFLNTAQCQSLQPKQSCILHLHLDQRLQEGSLLLNASVKTNDINYSLKQLIKYAHILEQAGTAIDATSPIIVNTKPNQEFSIAIPFVTDSPQNNQIRVKGKVNVIDSQIYCAVDNLHCTAVVAATSAQTTKAQIQVNNVNLEAQISTKSTANLIYSPSSVFFNPANGINTASITLLNNGEKKATNLEVTAIGVPNFSYTSTCNNNSLNVNELCVLTLKANSTGAAGGTGVVNVNYNTEFESPQLSFSTRVDYTSPGVSPGLSLSIDNQSFLNRFALDAPATRVITLKNSGSVDLAPINLSNVVKQDAYMRESSGTCTIVNNSIASLKAGESCTFSVTYAASTGDAGNLVIVAVANYFNPVTGSTAFISSNILNLNYVTNPAVVYLPYNVAIGNGLSRCNLASNGNFNSCVATGASMTGITPTWVSTVTAANGVEQAYISDNNGNNLYKCNITGNSYDLTSCTKTALSYKPYGNTIYNFAGTNYLYVTNFTANSKSIVKYRLDNTTGAFLESKTLTIATSSVPTYIYSLTFYNGNAYIVGGNGTGTTTSGNLIICPVQSDGNFGASGCNYYFTPGGLSAVSYNLFSIIFVPLSSTTYAFYDTYSTTNNGMGSCTINSSDGRLSTCTNVTPGSNPFWSSNPTAGQFMQIITPFTLNGSTYIYSGGNGLSYRIPVNSNGTTQLAQTITTSGTLVASNRISGVIKNIQYLNPALSVSGATTLTLGSSTSESLVFVTNSNVPSTTVTLIPPSGSGITVSQNSVNVSNTSSVASFVIRVPSSTATGTYTLKSSNTNGVTPLSFNFKVQ